MRQSRLANKRLLLLVVMSILLLAFITAIAWNRRDAPEVQPGQNQSQKTEEPITIKGKLLCLPHKGDPEITTTECAYGVKADDGTNYSLRDSDPQGRNIFDVPFDKPIAVTGTIEHLEDKTYESAGRITVTEVKEL